MNLPVKRGAAIAVLCQSQAAKRSKEHIDLLFDCRQRDLRPDVFDILDLPELHARFPFREARANERAMLRLIERDNPMRGFKIDRGALKRHAGLHRRRCC